MTEQSVAEAAWSEALPTPGSGIFESVLVVDTSDVARWLLASLLSPYTERMQGARSVGAARAIASTCLPSLVVLDANADGAFDWLEEIAGLGEKPAVLLLTTQVDAEQESRAMLLGAVGYLAKPLPLHRLIDTLRIPARSIPPVHSPPITTLTIDDEKSGIAQVCCDVMTMNPDGAVISMPARVPVETRLRLCLTLPERSVALRGRVVDRQEPAWGVMGCLGIAFEDPEAECRHSMERFLAERLDSRP